MPEARERAEVSKDPWLMCCSMLSFVRVISKGLERRVKTLSIRDFVMKIFNLHKPHCLKTSHSSIKKWVFRY